MSGDLLPETDVAFRAGVGSIIGELISWAGTSVMRAIAATSGSGNRLGAYGRGFHDVRERLPEYEKRLLELALGLGIRDSDLIAERLAEGIRRVGSTAMGVAASLGGRDSISAHRQAVLFKADVEARAAGIRSRILPLVAIQRRQDDAARQPGAPSMIVPAPAKKRAISDLLQSAEQTWLDWKKAFPAGLTGGGKNNPQWDIARGTLLKDAVSVANSIVDECGYVAYGVDDLGSVRKVVGLAGAHFDDALFQDWNRATFDPPIEFRYSEVPHDQLVIGLFEITPSSEYPHVCKKTVADLHEGQVWFRKGTRNTVALHRELHQLFSPGSPLRTTEHDGDLVRQVKDEWEPRGWVCVWESISDVDERIAQGYRLARPAGSRREIRYAPSNIDSHVLMLRKKT